MTSKIPRILGIIASGCAAIGCGSDDLFALQVGGNERELDSEAAIAIGSDEYAFDQLVVVGDLDGDGIDDAIVRPRILLPSGGSSRDYASNLFVLYGGRTLGSELTLEALPSVTGIGGAEMYTTILPAGDVDGDGLADVLITRTWRHACLSQTSSEEEKHAGAYLLYGSATRLHGATPAADATVFLRHPDSCREVNADAGLGDLDGDGNSDFALFTERANWDDDTVWHEYVFYGRSARLAGTVDLVATADADLQLPALLTWQRNLFGVGDVDGDGHDDFVARLGVKPGSYSLELRLVHGQAARLAGTVALADLSQSRFVGEDLLVWRGTGDAVYPLGDLDGDGISDFALVGTSPGVRELPDAKPFALRVFYGRRGGFPAEVDVTTADAAIAIEVRPDDVNYVINLASGDVDGDGAPDLVIGNAARHEQDGALQILEGKGNGERFAGEINSAIAGLTYAGTRQRLTQCQVDASHDCIGHERAGGYVGVGDLTGDGHADVLVSAPWYYVWDYGTVGLFGAISRAYVLSPSTAPKP